VNAKRAISAAVATAVLVAAASAQAAVNIALSADGASVASTSSFINAGDTGVMTADLLTSSKTAWYFDGDTRYIFGANDPNGSIVINLGKVRDLTSIAASVDLPSQGDRPVTGPVEFLTSLDGKTWNVFGSPVAIDGGSTDPISVSGPPVQAQYVEYEFGATGSDYGGFGGAAVNSIAAYAASVPEPAAWAMLIAGVSMIGFALRRRRDGAPLAA
jgi:hypothetical protein